MTEFLHQVPDQHRKDIMDAIKKIMKIDETDYRLNLIYCQVIKSTTACVLEAYKFDWKKPKPIPTFEHDEPSYTGSKDEEIDNDHA